MDESLGRPIRVIALAIVVIMVLMVADCAGDVVGWFIESADRATCETLPGMWWGENAFGATGCWPSA